MKKRCQNTIFGSSGFSFQFFISKIQGSGTLPWNINGSSSFCKGPRTSKVWKSKDPQGPRTLRLCMSEDLCKNYYSHLYFTVVTFLTKIQNWSYITKNNLSKHNCQKSWMVKTTTVQKIWMGKTTTIQVFDHMTKNLDSSRISIPLFLLVRFWILARNAFYHSTDKWN